jgi:hypothetical protein
LTTISTPVVKSSSKKIDNTLQNEIKALKKEITKLNTENSKLKEQLQNERSQNSKFKELAEELIKFYE